MKKWQILVLVITSVVCAAALALGIAYFATAQPEQQAYSLNTTTLNLLPGESSSLRLDPTPEGEVVWASDNEAVATVSGGLVTGVSVGTATVTASHAGQTYTCSVTVYEEEIVTAYIELTRSEARMPVGSDETVRASLTVNGEASSAAVRWTVDGDCTYEAEGNSLYLDYTHVGTVTVRASFGGAAAVYIVSVIPLSQTKLADPVPVLDADGETVVWDPVPNASGYEVLIKGADKDLFTTETSFLDTSVLYRDDAYTLSVRAVADPVSAYTDSSAVTIGVERQHLLLREAGSRQLTVTEQPGASRYVLIVNDTEAGDINDLSAPIDVSGYVDGDNTLCVEAVMPGGEKIRSRSYTYADLEEGVTIGNKWHSNGEVNKDPAYIHGSLNNDSSVRIDCSGTVTDWYAGNISFTNKDWDIRTGNVISYWIYIDSILAYDEKGENPVEWTDMDLNALPSPLGNRMTTADNIAGETVQFAETGKWYYVSYFANSDMGSKVTLRWQFKSGETYVYNSRGDTGYVLSYVAYIDGLRVSSGGSSDPDMAVGSVSAWWMSMTYTDNSAYLNGDDSTVSIRVNAISGTDYYSGNLRLRNAAWDIKAGDRIVYDLYIAEIKAYPNNDKKQTPYESWNDVDLGALFTPIGERATNSSNVGGAEYVEVGKWVTVQYAVPESSVADGNTGGTDIYLQMKTAQNVSTSNPTLSRNSDGDTAYFVDYTAYIDNIRIEEGDPEEAVGKTGNSNPANAPQAAIDYDIFYGQESDASVKINVSEGSASGTGFTGSIDLMNPNWDIKTGDTISYYIRIEGIKAQLDYNNGTPKTADQMTEWTDIEIAGLPAPGANRGTAAANITLADGTGGTVEFVQAGQWYKVTYTATKDFGDTITLNWQSKVPNSGTGTAGTYTKNSGGATAYFYVFDYYMDCITITPSAQ